MPYRDKKKARDYQREYRRTRRAGDCCTTPCTTPLPMPFRIKTATDVLDLIGQQIAAVQSEPEADTLEKARCIGYLTSVALKAIEAGNMAARIEALETILSQRERRASA